MKHQTRHQNLKIVFAILALLSLWTCERDDICASATPTTPHLVIRFYNIDAKNETKTVRHLSIITEDHDQYLLHDRTLDSIVLPLKLEALDNLNSTRFLFTKDTDFDLDNDPETVSNTDVFEVSYTPELIYVSRACGYKSIFNNLGATHETDADNWIIDFEVINTTIDHEHAAHINIYH